MSAPARWGIVSTIKAPCDEILTFVAFHLDTGADRMFIFLDDDAPLAQAALQAHPKVKVIRTDEAYWQDRMGRRPVKHQVRQVRNASRAYRMAKDLDWLAHIDVDEFLCADTPIAQQLAQVPEDTDALRIRPYEALCQEGQSTLDPTLTYCKAKIPGGSEGMQLEQQIYPNFGGFFKSGFISHTAGKLFVRSGLKDVKFAIHRAFGSQTDEIRAQDSTDIDLCHRHVQSWEKWLQIMTYRLEKGSYRAELEQNIARSAGRISKHALFTSLTAEGTDDLRQFFEETCLATPNLVSRLEGHGLLRKYQLDLLAKMQRQFPDFPATVSKT